MPEETSTGKFIFPIRDAKTMKKKGWFVRETNTSGVSVRLARLKSNDNVVVQAYIFDSKKGWTMAKAKKWLKSQGIKWIAELKEGQEDLKVKCLKIEIIKMVISGDDAPELNNHHTPKERKKKKKRMVKTTKKIKK